MEGRPHIGESLIALKSTKPNEIVTVCDGRAQTGAQLVDRIAALCIGLRRLGLQPGDRVALAALNSEWYLEWLLAVPSAGGIIAPLNHRWSVEEASAAIRDIQATTLVVDDLCLGWASLLKTTCPSLARVVYIGRSRDLNGAKSSVINAESIIHLEGPAPELQLRHAPNSIALICFTSGTTGRPKGVAISHKALIVQSDAKIKLVGYSANDVYLHTATMGHIGGISSALATVTANACHIILPKFQPETVFESIRKHSVSTMIIVPAMLNDMISIVKGAGGPTTCFPTVSTILNGAGGLSSSQIEEAKSLFPAAKIMSAYGMTESASSVTFHLLHDPKESFRNETIVQNDALNLRKKGIQVSSGGHLGGVCAGKPAPHVEIRIMAKGIRNSDKHMGVTSNVTESDPSTMLGINLNLRDNFFPGEELSTAGNVLTRGPHVMVGYWGQPVQTENVLNPDGWLDTGDIGWIDEWGQLWLLGRQKDVIKTGGENVYASEVEAVLGRHPAVLAAASVGVPDKRLGEAVAALVRTPENWSWDSVVTPDKAVWENDISESLLRAHCKQQGLSRYKVPKFIFFQKDPFPVTSTGKVKKDLVQALVIAQLEGRYRAEGEMSKVSKQGSSSSIRTFIRSRL